jgi:hypothetical protein
MTMKFRKMIAFYFGRKKQNEPCAEHGDVVKTGRVAADLQRSDTFALSVGLLWPSGTGCYSLGKRD